MKICFLTDDPSVIGGGAEHIRRTSSLLAKFGHSVDVVTPLTMDPKFDVGNFFQRVKFAFWILKFLLTSDYDLYHSHAFSTDAFLPVVKLTGKKTAITVHGVGLSLVGGGILNKTGIPGFLRWIVLNIWPYDFRFSASKLKNFVTVGNGVDIDKFSKIKRTRHKNFNILTISRRDSVKGINILEEAVKKIPRVKLNLVSGRHWTSDDFARADCYVLPSLSEGLPIVILEAMAAKLPVVATDVGDCREMVTKAKCGIIVKPGSVEELSKAILTMMKSKNRSKMGERGFIFVKENYTWDKVVELYAQSYLKQSIDEWNHRSSLGKNNKNSKNN